MYLQEKHNIGNYNIFNNSMCYESQSKHFKTIELQLCQQNLVRTRDETIRIFFLTSVRPKLKHQPEY